MKFRPFQVEAAETVFFNCSHTPLLDIPQPVLYFTPPPPLHLNLGLTNQLMDRFYTLDPSYKEMFEQFRPLRICSNLHYLWMICVFLSNFYRLINFCRLIKLLSCSQLLLSAFDIIHSPYKHVPALHNTHAFGSAFKHLLSCIASPAIHAASSQYQAFWFVLQLRPLLIDSGAVETIFTKSYRYRNTVYESQQFTKI